MNEDYKIHEQQAENTVLNVVENKKPLTSFYLFSEKNLLFTSFHSFVLSKFRRYSYDFKADPLSWKGAYSSINYIDSVSNTIF